MRQHRTAAFAAFAAFLLLSACGPKDAGGAQAPAQARPQPLVDLERLASDEMEGRLVGTEGSDRARAYLALRYNEIGLEMIGRNYLKTFNFERPIDFRDPDAGRRALTGVNIVGFVDGTSSDEEGPVMVVTAHYDHLGVREGEIYNGADDNASGVAAMLAVAQDFVANPPAHDTLFVALDAEEGGLNGARAFIAEPPVDKDRIVFNLNFDMVAQNEAGEIYAVGQHHFPWVAPYLDEIERNAPATVLRGHDSPEWGDQDWTSQSDHFAFFSEGVAFIYFGVEDHPHYHRPTDTFETIPQRQFLDFVETLNIAARVFANNLDDIAEQHAAVQASAGARAAE